MELFKKRLSLKCHYNLFFPHSECFSKSLDKGKKNYWKTKTRSGGGGGGSEELIEVMFHVYTSVGELQTSSVNYRHAKRNMVHLINRPTSDQDLYSRTFSTELTEQWSGDSHPSFLKYSVAGVCRHASPFPDCASSDRKRLSWLRWSGQTV